MGILTRLIPAWALVAVFAALAFVIMGQEVRVSAAKGRVVRAEKALSDTRAQYAEAARAAEAAARTEETRRADAVRKVVNYAQTQAAQARMDADAAGRAADSLRGRVAALVASSRAASKNPAPASGSAPADPLAVFADVFGRLDDAAGRYAAAADSAHVAGLACQRYAESIQPTQ